MKGRSGCMNSHAAPSRRKAARALACTAAALLMGGLAGCGAVAPARTPAQLAHTPGAPVVLANQRYRGAAFTVDYPGGWTVITGAASAPPWVVFVSPDESAVIALSQGALDPLPQPPVVLEDAVLRTETRTHLLASGEQVYAALIAPEAAWEATLRVFERMLATAAAP